MKRDYITGKLDEYESIEKVMSLRLLHEAVTDLRVRMQAVEDRLGIGPKAELSYEETMRRRKK